MTQTGITDSAIALAVHQFVGDVEVSETVWFLGKDGHIQGGRTADDTSDVTPFWSSKEATETARQLWGQDLVVASMALAEFLGPYLEFSIESEKRVGLNWNTNMAGCEMRPDEIRELFPDWGPEN